LIEIGVPPTDRNEVDWGDQTHHLIGDALESCRGVWCAGRHGEDQPMRSPLPQRSQRGFRGDARRETVIDKHDISVTHLHEISAQSVLLDSAIHFSLLHRDQLFETVTRQAQHSKRVFVGDDYASLRDRPDPILVVAGSAHLACHEDIQRSIKYASGLERHRHPATGQRQHHRPREAQLL